MGCPDDIRATALFRLTPFVSFFHSISEFTLATISWYTGVTLLATNVRAADSLSVVRAWPTCVGRLVGGCRVMTRDE